MLGSELVSLCLHSELYSPPRHPLSLLHPQFRNTSLIPNVLCFSNDVLLLILTTNWILFAMTCTCPVGLILQTTPSLQRGFLPPPWRQGDRWSESFESWDSNSSLHSEWSSIPSCCMFLCHVTHSIWPMLLLCVWAGGTVFDLNETLRSCRLAKNFGIKLGDCSTEHLAQVVVFTLRFLKTCWDAFIVDSKIWHGHFPKLLWEWWLYANCEVSA